MDTTQRNGLVLSLFPGVDLFGRGFELEGYQVVRGPDPLWGGRIEDFHCPPGVFEGVIGGSPCQDFSRLRRTPPTGDGLRLLAEFVRVVTDANPTWFMLENVPGVPSILISGFTHQRLNLNATECGLSQRRNRTFQFGRRDAAPLVIRRRVTTAAASQACCTASEGRRKGRRGWEEFCELQGLPRDFDLPPFTKGAKYRAVGNGVPVPVGRVLAAAIRARAVTPDQRLCVCECGRPVEGKQLAATAACRKRMERRRRDFAGVTEPGPVTHVRSRRNGVTELEPSAIEASHRGERISAIGSQE